MCGSCWVKYGKPVVWNQDVAEAVRLLGRLYALEETGGPLHVEVDDWNIDGEKITPTYEIPARGQFPGCPDRYSAEVHEVCDQLAALLTKMPPEWRASALAHHEKFAVEGQVVIRG